MSQPADSEEKPVYNPPPPNHGTSPPFSILTKLFERVQNERKHDKRRRAIEIWFKNYREQVGNDFYEVLRLILPQKDRERAVYQLKEKNLAKLFIRAIPLGKADPDAIRLLNWKKPAGQQAAGDFPSVLYDVISKRSSVTSTSMTIAQVNDALGDIANAGGKMDNQMSSIQLMYNKCTPGDQRWIIRIILKDLIISVKETTVFAVFHPDAQALFNTCSDLKRVAYELWDPLHSLNPEEKAVQLFRAFAPMLCKRPMQNIEMTVKKMSGMEFIIEEKLDGERMQLHKRGNEYFYCSRKGKDYTYLYGKHVGEGSLTPYIHGKAFHEDATDLIIDGEMLVFDPELDRYLPFGHLKTAALDKSKKIHRPRPCFKIFDILMVNGSSLLERSTLSRRKNLQHVVREIKGRIEYATSWKGKTARHVRERMEEVMNARGEGLVIKHPQSQYILNGRNEDWIKVKPEYLDNMGETVDVLVTSGNYGSGKRGGGVSTLICSVRDDSAGQDEDSPRYRTFVRIGSGLTYTDYLEIRAKPWKPFDKAKPPPWLLSAAKGMDDKGDVYLEPEDSFLIKVKAADITPSDQYHMGVTMRFPRAVSIRDDLDIADCATAAEVMDGLRQERKRKLEKASDNVAKKKKVTTSKSKMTTFDHRRAPAGIEDVQAQSMVFEGLKFHVLLEGKPTSAAMATQRKHELESLIVANGGDFSAGYKHDGAVIILYGGESKPAPVSAIIRLGERDIVRSQWVRDCVAQDRLLPRQKKYMFFATERSKNEPDYEGSDTEDDGDEDDIKAEPMLDSNVPEPDVKMETRSGSQASDDETVGASKDDEPASETDPESDEATDEDLDTLVGEADRDEEMLAPSGPAPSEPDDSKASPGIPKDELVDAPIEYDKDRLFGRFCFYLDTDANATRCGLKLSQTSEGGHTFDEVANKITAMGGKLVELDDPLLTHVVFDSENTSRRIEIRKRVCRGLERYLVVTEWVDACIEDDTLVDEMMFAA